MKNSNDGNSNKGLYSQKSLSGYKFTPEEEKQIEAALEERRRLVREEMVKEEINIRLQSGAY
jgi:hypothetical protein